MFDINFVPESMKAPTASKLDRLEAASETNLRYGYFGTTVSIVTDGFGTESLHGTPALDFVFCLLYAVRKVRDGVVGSVSFTEDDTLINFTPANGRVMVTRSWDAVPGYCDTAQLVEVSIGFSEEVVDFIVRRYPSFGRNPTYGKLMSIVEELKAG
ncbi:hypothetical protein [Streptomyces sp. NPDC005784]|uniref:hypothetical protein n=1 Tax=Streptomyces sp. NPDC005784 TaxID=3364731 RepID=UPI0036B68A5E